MKVAFEAGALNRVGEIAKAEGATRVLLVTDAGIRDAGHAERAVRALYGAGLVCRIFDGVKENPTTTEVLRGQRVAADFKPDFIIGLGGGSSMDCAKGINFVHTNGGRMADYWGVNKATQPMLPLIAIPTTAGTGSDAQSFALITDPETHQKMACGDVKASARVAILDPELTATQPPRVAAATGIDAVAHAVETAVSKKRNETSLAFSAAAWELLNRSFEAAVNDPTDAARADMLVGSHLAGCAIENSMLGIAHSLANPLTGHHGIVHGFAVGMMLPHVVRFNAEADAGIYAAIMADAGALAARLEQMLGAGRIPRRLSALGVTAAGLPALAEEAAKQWTAGFNPRAVTAGDLLGIYRGAM